MVNSPFDDVKILFTKQGELSKHPAWFMINRIISMSGKHLGIATKMDKYIFKLQDKPELMKLIYNGIIPKQRQPWFNYIRKTKAETSNYDFLFDEIQEFFHWTEKDFRAMKPLLLHLVKNENKLRKMLKFIGAEEKQYKKLGITFDIESKGLGTYFN